MDCMLRVAGFEIWKRMLLTLLLKRVGGAVILISRVEGSVCL